MKNQPIRSQACPRILWGVALTVLAAVVLSMLPWRPTFNKSVSMEVGFYLITEKPQGTAFARGTPVSYRYRAPDWAALIYEKHFSDGMRFLKVVGAVPGDYLFSEADKVYRCPTKVRDAGCELLAVRQVKDGLGNKLPAISYAGEQIPAGHYWLKSGEAKARYAFDSRYLGVVPRTRIEGTLSRIFTWGGLPDEESLDI